MELQDLIFWRHKAAERHKAK
ncbi:GpE family phage tail protein [Bartonella ancashensis]